MEQARYILKVTNTTDKLLKFVLFGGNHYKSSNNYGSEEGVDVSLMVNNVTYLQLLNQSIYQPIEVHNIKIYSGSSIQRKRTLRITSTYSNDHMCSTTIQPIEYMSYENEAIDIVDIPYDMQINGDTDISSEISPHTEVIFMFYGKIKDDRSFIKKILWKLNMKIQFFKFKMKVKKNN